MDNIISFETKKEDILYSDDSCDEIESIIKLCADSNLCCDFDDGLSHMTGSEVLEEELELVAGGKSDMWSRFIESINEK